MKMVFDLNSLKPLILGMVVRQQLGIVNETIFFDVSTSNKNILYRGSFYSSMFDTKKVLINQNCDGGDRFEDAQVGEFFQLKQVHLN